MIEALVAFLPVGTRKIFAHFASPATEWNALFVSATDLLLLALAAAVVFRRRNRARLFALDTSALFLLLFIAVLGLTIAWHGTAELSLFRYAKLLLFLVFPLAVRAAFWGRSRMLIAIFLAVAVFESVLAVGQFFRQADFGLQWLGESPLDSTAAGIAKIDVGRTKLARAYGTFPHANALGAYLVAALFFVWAAMARGKFLWVAGLFPIVFALFVTFSREAMLGLFAGILFAAGCLAWRRRANLSGTFRTGTIGFFVALALAFLVFGISLRQFWASRVVPSASERAVSERLFYLRSAFSMIRQHPVIGVGFGNFADALPEYVRPRPVAVPSAAFPLWLLQPVHNIYLLVAAEAGIFAAALFILFLGSILIRAIRNQDRASLPFVAAFAAMLAIGVFDHFFLTIQQGALLFWFLAGIVMAEAEPS